VSEEQIPVTAVPFGEAAPTGPEAPTMAAATGGSALGHSPPSEPPDPEEVEIAEGDRRESAARPVPRVVVPRWVQLVLLPFLVLVPWVIVERAGKVLLLFLVAGLIALVLNPLVALVRRSGVPRGFAVLLVYLLFFLVIAGIGVLLANPISNQVTTFAHNLPSIVRHANKTLANLQTTLNHDGLHVQFIKQGETALQTLQDKVSKAAGSLVSFGGGLLTSAVKTGFDIVIVFVLSIYMLVYGPRIGELARRAMPAGDGTPADDYPTLMQQAVSSYVRAQLAFSLVMGTTAAIALYIFGVIGLFPPGKTYAIAFGAILAVAEFIPYIGPFLGALPPILVALFTDPITALWVALLFLGLQQLEGHIVAPQIFGHSLRINPLLVIFALLVGQHLDGIIGALVALPTIALIRETVLYLSRHLTLESWEKGPGPLL
jgi:predicted PurR-regulated permease PerM